MHEVLEQNDLQRLCLNEGTLQQLVEATGECALFCLDLQGKVVTWSNTAQWVEGHATSEILGRHFSCLYADDHVNRDKPVAHLREALEQGTCQDEVWHLRSDGSGFLARILLTALRDEQGVPVGFAHVTCDLTARMQSEDALRQSERLFDGFSGASPAGLAIVDRSFRYQTVNEAMTAIDHVSSEAHLGRTVREVIPALAGQIEPHLKQVLLTGKKTLNHELSGPMPGEEGATGHWVANYFPVIGEAGEVAQVGCVLLDITDCRRAEESLRRLTGRLMELQDQERRRIARELHDSIGQCLTAIKINLDFLDRELSGSSLSSKAAQALGEALTLSDQCASDTRTISYLLHPPLLDERGLASAIRWYADGFAQRSGIQLSLDLPADETRLPQSLETTLFRIVQESLTNIHRHSESRLAAIRLLTSMKGVLLEVRDQGKGMPEASLQRCNSNSRPAGVGIAGMRERVRQFGGQLHIQSTPRGTTVRATLPLGGAA